MGEAYNRVVSICLKFLRKKLRFKNGSRSPEAHEARRGAQALDAGQIGRMLRPEALVRSPQAPRVLALGALLEESSQVRLELHGGQEDPGPASRQSRWSSPHRPHLPSGIHGRLRDGEERRKLSLDLRRQRKIQ